MDGPVRDDEPTVCFAFETNKIKVDGIDHRAFLPSRNPVERSLTRSEGLTPAEIVVFGDHAGVPRGKSCLGWGILAAAVYRRFGLDVLADEPPDRHAVARLWPDALEQQRSIAIALASEATTVRRGS